MNDKEKSEKNSPELERMKMILNKVYNQGGGLYDFDITNPENWDDVAKKLVTAYASRHFLNGSDEQVVALLKGFLTNRIIFTTLFATHGPLNYIGGILINCKDNSEIREWAVDLYGRTCDLKDLDKLFDLLEREENVKVQQEIIATFSKILMQRAHDMEILIQIENNYIQFRERISNTGEKGKAGLANAMNIFENIFLKSIMK